MRLLFAGEDGLNIEVAEAFAQVEIRFDLFRVGDGLAEHLVATADADNLAASLTVIVDRPDHAALPQPGEIGDGALAAREDEEVEPGNLTCFAEVKKFDSSRPFEGVEVSIVGDVRKFYHADAQGLA